MADHYYAPLAYDSTRPRPIPPADESKFGFGQRTLRRHKLPNFGHAQCREYFSRFKEVQIIEQLNANTAEVQKELQELGHEIQYWETLRNPKAILEVITKVIFILGICAWLWFLLFAGFALFERPDWFLTKDFVSFLFGISIPTIWWILAKILLMTNLFKHQNNILFHRRKGTISIPRKKSPPLELPFDEFEGFLGSSVNPSGSTDYHLILAHRYTATLIQNPSGHQDPCVINVEWEIMQQFMDISKPLPDIPSAEPFRERDPVTATYDKQLNRPPRYWRDMDIAKAKQMQDAAYKAASQYPWGLTREQALASGWQPSGFGEGDWRKEH
jgi:hypothetical protein